LAQQGWEAASLLTRFSGVRVLPFACAEIEIDSISEMIAFAKRHIRCRSKALTCRLKSLFGGPRPVAAELFGHILFQISLSDGENCWLCASILLDKFSVLFLLQRGP
jgi:hypothetical protein